MHSGIMLADETSKLQKYIPRRRLNEAKQRMINSIALYQATAAKTTSTYDCTTLLAVFESINESVILEALVGDMSGEATLFDVEGVEGWRRGEE
jgi:hypothetical protein